MSLVRKIGKLGSAAVLATGIGSTAVAQDEQGGDVRVRTDYFGDVNDSHTIETDVGIAKRGVYDGDRIGVLGQFLEDIRFRNISTINNGDLSNLALLGIRGPEFDIGDVSNKLFLYGAVGDEFDGFTVESTSQLGDLTLTLNAGRRFAENDATHLGLGLDYRVDPNLLIGGGFDSVEDDSGRRNQILCTTEIRLTDNDTLGFAYVHSDNPDGSIDHGLGGMWIHYTAEESPSDWGIRARMRYDWNDERDTRSFNGELIVALGTPTTSEPGATWIIGRNLRDDEMYHTSVIPLALNTNATRLPDRSERGLSLAVSGDWSEVGDTESWSLGGDLAYMWSKDIGMDEFGVSGGLSYDGNAMDGNAGFIYRNGSFTADIGVGLPLTTDGTEKKEDVTLRAGLQVKF